MAELEERRLAESAEKFTQRRHGGTKVHGDEYGMACGPPACGRPDE